MAKIVSYNPKWDLLYLNDEINKLNLRVMALEEEIRKIEEEKNGKQSKKSAEKLGKRDA